MRSNGGDSILKLTTAAYSPLLYCDRVFFRAASSCESSLTSESEISQ